jgi:hypothetical protein
LVIACSTVDFFMMFIILSIVLYSLMSITTKGNHHFS